MKIKEKVLLELAGLKKTRKNSLKIAAEMTDAMMRILSEKIKREKKGITKKELINELRKMTMRK